MWVFVRHLMLVTLVLGLVLAVGSRRTESPHGLDGPRAQSGVADDARDPFVVGHHRAAARVVGPSVPARPQRAGPLVGIAEQKPTMFASRAWQRLPGGGGAAHPPNGGRATRTTPTDTAPP